MDSLISISMPARRLAGCALILGTFSMVVPARAITLDFSAFESTDGAYIEDGFELSSDYWLFSAIHDDDDVCFLPAAWNQTNTLRPLAVTVFDLVSVDMCEFNGNSGPQTVEFSGNLLGGGTVSQTFTTDGPWGFQTYTFGPQFTGLTSLVWDQDNPRASLVYDNIVVQEGVVAVRPSEWSAIKRLYAR